MTLYQTNQAIRTLRAVSHENPLPMKMHDEITRSLINLLNHKESLNKLQKLGKVPTPNPL